MKKLWKNRIVFAFASALLLALSFFGWYMNSEAEKEFYAVKDGHDAFQDNESIERKIEMLKKGEISEFRYSSQDNDRYWEQEKEYGKQLRSIASRGKYYRLTMWCAGGGFIGFALLSLIRPKRNYGSDRKSEIPADLIGSGEKKSCNTNICTLQIHDDDSGNRK